MVSIKDKLMKHMTHIFNEKKDEIKMLSVMANPLCEVLKFVQEKYIKLSRKTYSAINKQEIHLWN